MMFDPNAPSKAVQLAKKKVLKNLKEWGMELIPEGDLREGNDKMKASCVQNILHVTCVAPNNQRRSRKHTKNLLQRFH